MKGFNRLQLISIKNPIFNVPLNIFLFNNWKNSNACRFLNSYALKWYVARRLEKLFRGHILYRSLVPTINNGVSAECMNIRIKFLNELSLDPFTYCSQYPEDKRSELFTKLQNYRNCINKMCFLFCFWPKMFCLPVTSNLGEFR